MEEIPLTVQSPPPTEPVTIRKSPKSSDIRKIAKRVTFNMEVDVISVIDSNESVTSRLPLNPSIEEKPYGFRRHQFPQEPLRFHPDQRKFTGIIAILLLIFALGFLYFIFVPTTKGEHYRIHSAIPYELNNFTTPPKFLVYNIGIFDWRKLFGSYDMNPFDMAPDYGYFLQSMEFVMYRNDEHADIAVNCYGGCHRPSYRYINDFTNNQTILVEESMERCYFMALNYNDIVKPKQFLNFIDKVSYIISAGKPWPWKRNSRIYRKMGILKSNATLLVTKLVWNHCQAKICYQLKDLGLENRTMKMEKKQNMYEDGRFAQFMGISIVEYALLNYDELSQINEKNRVQLFAIEVK